MCDIYHHPSSPPPKLQDRPQLPAEFQPTDEETYVSTRSGELAVDPSPQHAATVLRALRGELPAGTCTGCGEPTALHYDTSGLAYIGCDGVASRKALKALRSRPMRDTFVSGDEHPLVSAALRDALLAGCGPAVTYFYETLGWEDRLMLSRRLAELACIAHDQEKR